MHVCVCTDTSSMYLCFYMYMNGCIYAHTHTHTYIHQTANCKKFCSNFTLLCHLLPLMKAHHSFPPPLTELLGEEVGDWHPQPPLSQAQLTRSLVHIVVEQKWSVREWKTESSLSTGSLSVLGSRRRWVLWKECGVLTLAELHQIAFCWFHLLNVIVAHAYETQK